MSENETSGDFVGGIDGADNVAVAVWRGGEGDDGGTTEVIDRSN